MAGRLKKVLRFCVRWTLRTAVVVAVLAAVFVVVSWFCIGWTDEGSDTYAGGVVLRDAAGDVLRVSLGPNDVDCRPYYRASADDWIVKALVASEDGTFWSHCGVRPLSMLRATWQNVISRRRISGASTITMQAVRLIRPHPKTLWWKWKEAVMAVKMDRAKPKEWILTQYLNRAPYGSNFIGIEAAAMGWFGKGAKDLGLGEAAMLAGMVQAPSRMRPDRGYDRAIRRRDYVLDRMQDLGMATTGQVAAARSVRPVVCRAPRPFKCPYYCDWYLGKLGRDRAAQRLSGEFTTPLDPDVQDVCEAAVADAAKRGGYAAAAVVARVADGEVVALACSGDYFRGEDGQVNTAVAPRPAGSTLKPLLVALAMERGQATPGRRLADVPRSYRGYRPANFDAKFRGIVSVREALIQSLNIPFVQLLDEVGVGTFGDSLRALGFSNLGADDASLGLGMAIGNAEVTLTELVGAYATVARGGVTASGVRLFSPGVCHLVSEMLSGDERSSAALGHVADVEVPRFAWKTGTSSAYRDAWTVAWNPEYVIGVWCGHLSGGFGDRSLVGAKAAAPVAWGIARQLYPRNGGPWFVEPGDVYGRDICAESGLAASANCPVTERDMAVRGRSSPVPCALAHAAAKTAAGTERLSVASPEDGAEFRLVGGDLRQSVVCRALGNPDGRKLWWFVDNVLAGTTEGGGSLEVPMTPGSHTVTCATASGEIATSAFTVTE